MVNKEKNNMSRVMEDINKELAKEDYDELSVTVDKDELKKLKVRLQAYQYIPLRYGREAFNNVSTYMRGKQGPIQKYFNQEKGPTGKWPILKPSTLKERARKRFPPGPILQRTGSLRRFATSKKASNIFVTVDEARFVLGHERGRGKQMNKYFTHMLGSDKGWGGADNPIPARPFIPSDPNQLTEEEQEKIGKIMKNTINSLARKKARTSV